MIIGMTPARVQIVIKLGQAGKPVDVDILAREMRKTRAVLMRVVESLVQGQFVGKEIVNHSGSPPDTLLYLLKKGKEVYEAAAALLSPTSVGHKSLANILRGDP